MILKFIICCLTNFLFQFISFFSCIFAVIFNSVQDDNEAAIQLMAEMFPELSGKNFKRVRTIKTVTQLLCVCTNFLQTHTAI